MLAFEGDSAVYWFPGNYMSTKKIVVAVSALGRPPAPPDLPQVTSGLVLRTAMLPRQFGAGKQRENPMTTITLKALLELLLGCKGLLSCAMPHGSLEFKGQVCT